MSPASPLTTRPARRPALLGPVRGPLSLTLLLLALAAPVRGDLVVEEAEGVAGLAPGDAVDAWRRLGPAGGPVAGGSLDDPFTLLAVLRDQVPRGSVEVRRGETWLPVPAEGARLSAVALPETAEALEQAAEAPERTPLARALLHSLSWRLLDGQRRSEEALAAAERSTEALRPVRSDWPVLAALVTAERAASLRSLGRLAASESALAEALESLERHVPGSSALAWALRQAANTAWLADDHDLAEDRVRRALRIRQKHALPVHFELSFLAILANQQGRLAEAEALYLRSMEGADERFKVACRGNLARLYLDRGELERARDLLRELVAWYQAQNDPGRSMVHAAALGNLAEAERRLGDLEEAERHVRGALALVEERSPGSISTADTLLRLGSVLRQRGRLEEARETLSRALEVASSARPDGAVVADAYAKLGAVALARAKLPGREKGAVLADLDEAERLYRRALGLQRRMFGGTWREAEWLHALGRIEATRGRRDAALDLFLDAVEVLEGLRGRLGGAHEASAGFTSLHHQLYWAPLDLLAESGRAAEAFALSERYRAQTLLELLARRRLDFSADLPPDLERERSRLASRYDGLLGRLGRADEADRTALREELDHVRLAQQEVEDRVRAASPRLAALRNPRPLDAVGAWDLLGNDAVLLSFVVGLERSWVFVLGPGRREVSAVQVPVGSADLAREVTLYRNLVARPSVRQAALRTAGETLTRQWLAPVAERLGEAARHLVVVPDGPLHLVPWSALPEPRAPSSDRDPAPGPLGAEPLIARHSVSVVASATVLAELLARRPTAPRELVAFGGVSAPDGGRPPADGGGREASGPSAPLAGALSEVEALGKLFGDGATLYVGADATEERLVAVAPSGRRLHLACHAVVDPLQPLESGLVLSPGAPGTSAGDPARETADGNGFLQVWEIYQRLRLDADLVTLSACDTALGRELTGEGVLGVTRAFHYAGARTVVSSLWKVSDRASALLMERFYRNLVAGLDKAEALRQAQLELMGGDEGTAGRAHPFYWAAFQVHGAWR